MSKRKKKVRTNSTPLTGLLSRPEEEVEKVDELVAKRLSKLCDQGLCSGLGSPEPGAMCVEAAVSYAFGLPHGDQPTCVDSELAAFKIGLNDTLDFSSDKARGKILKRIAIAQLGTGRESDFSWRKFSDAANEIIATEVAKIEASFNKRKAELFKETKAEVLEHLISDVKSAETYEELGQIETNRYDLGIPDDSEVDFEIHPNGHPSDWTDNLDDHIECLNAVADFRELTAKQKDQFFAEVIEKFVGLLKKQKTPGSKYLYLTE